MTTDSDWDFRIDDHTGIKITDDACVIILHTSGTEVMIRGFKTSQQAYDSVLFSQFEPHEYRIRLLGN